MIRRAPRPASRGRSADGARPRAPRHHQPALARPRRACSPCSRERTACRPRSCRTSIPLLAWDAVADHAMFALRKVAEEHVGHLVDALARSEPGFRRAAAAGARVLGLRVAARGGRPRARRSTIRDSTCDSSARDRSRPSSTRTRGSASTPTRSTSAVLREVTVGRGVWESRRLLDDREALTGRPRARRVRAPPRRREPRPRVHAALAGAAARAAADCVPQPAHRRRAAARHRARIPRRGAAAGDPPAAVALPRSAGPRATSVRPHEEVIADLLRSHHSININLDGLRPPAASVPVGAAGSGPWSKSGSFNRGSTRRCHGRSATAERDRCRRRSCRSRSSALRSARLVGAGLWTYGVVMDAMVRPLTLGSALHPANVAIETAAMAVSILMWIYVRFVPGAPGRKIDARPCLFRAERGRRRAPQQLDAARGHDPTVRLSWNTVVILLAAMIIPTTPRKMLVASLLAASMDPLAVWWRTCAALPCRRRSNTLVLLHAELRLRGRGDASVARAPAPRPPAARRRRRWAAIT